MTSQSPRIYTYKITFLEVPYYYYGVHKEKKFDEYYMGSPYTHKWCWDFYTPKKQILEFFDFTDEGWIEAQEVEKRLIKPFYNTDKWCLNENCGGRFSIEHQIKVGSIGANKCKELGIGIYALTLEQKSENGKRAKGLGVGVHSLSKEQLSENGKRGGSIGGKKAKELGLGIHGRTKEQMTEDGKRGGSISGKINGQISYKLGTGIFSLTAEQRKEANKKGGLNGGSKGAKKTNSQRWMCLETGFITNSGSLSRYQKARGIDTFKRKRIA